MRLSRYCLWLVLVLVLSVQPCAAENADINWSAESASEPQPQPGISFVLRGEALARSGDPFAAINEYRKAIAAGYEEADVFRSLSTVLYLAGFPNEAADVLKEAVRLHPKDIFPRQELGVLHFATGHDAEAKEDFLSVLAVNPTLANAYYYLGLLAFRHQQYDEAWLYARRAQLLGHKATSLLDKLLPLGNEPMVDQQEPIGEELCFRQILVSTYEEAEGIFDRIKQGETFEVVASLASVGMAADNGGFVGCLYPDEFDPVVGAALWQMKPYSEPVIVETEGGAHLVQRVQRFDTERWRIQLAALKQPKPTRNANLVNQGKEGEGRYVVTAGTYNGPVLAATMVSRLRENKFPAYVQTSPGKKGRLVYRVVAGRYNGNADAAASVKRLKDLGVVGVITDEGEKKGTPQAEKKAIAAGTADEKSVGEVTVGGLRPSKPAAALPAPDVPAEKAQAPAVEAKVAKAGVTVAPVSPATPEEKAQPPAVDVKEVEAEATAASVSPTAPVEKEQAPAVEAKVAEVAAAVSVSPAVPVEKMQTPAAEAKVAKAEGVAAPVSPAAPEEKAQAPVADEKEAEAVAAAPVTPAIPVEKMQTPAAEAKVAKAEGVAAPVSPAAPEEKAQAPVADVKEAEVAAAVPVSPAVPVEKTQTPAVEAKVVETEVVAAPASPVVQVEKVQAPVAEAKVAEAEAAAVPVSPATPVEKVQTPAVEEKGAETAAAPTASQEVPVAQAPVTEAKTPAVEAVAPLIAAPPVVSEKAPDAVTRSGQWPSKAALSVPLIVESRGAEPAGRYTLHAGISNDRGEAEASILRMREAGLEAFAYPAPGSQTARQDFRLVGGRFNTLKEARAASRRLAELGIKTFIANTK
ncbi:MAG: SPOR domain-containing protein [Desulfobulbaceae bacterium]|nr:SPOR domain-containing protein [Desulfobulbaceae bacterium]